MPSSEQWLNTGAKWRSLETFALLLTNKFSTVILGLNKDFELQLRLLVSPACASRSPFSRPNN